MRNIQRKILPSLLAVIVLTASMGISAFAAESKGAVPADSEILSIQAATAPNFYGHKVETIEITYKSGTDLSGVTEDSYTVYDRGFNNPDFGEVELIGSEVNGDTVTLYVDQGSDKVTDRTRESYGLLCTSSNWYIDSEGVIHYGDKASTDALGIEIQPNTISKGLQRRQNLDLILCSGGKDITEGIASTDGAGKLLEDTVWKETILGGGLDKVQYTLINIGTPAEGYTMQGSKGEVPTFIIYPDNYNPNRAEPYPVVDYQTGGGVCYWEVTDGSTTDANNLGCNTVYDNMMTEWHRLLPDAIIVSVNVHSPDVALSGSEIVGVFRYGVKNLNFDPDRILLVGNSQGTLISSEVIRQAPELVAGYVECNGNLGSMATAADVDGTLANSSLGTWDVEEVQAMIENNVAVWMFNGETDGDNPAAQQDVIEIVKDLYREAGKSEIWINTYVRASGLQSWKFKEWGETDHSVTKVVAWNYLANPYTNVWKGKADLAVGAKYTYAGEEENSAYKDKAKIMDYEYTVYPESVSEWARILFDMNVAGDSFTDVPAAHWASKYVSWAVKNHITVGMGDGIFAPDQTCTKAQIITMLWNAAGQPVPAIANPFTDVAENAWYYNAVLWAYEEGMVDAGALQPDADCTRAMTVEYLWRQAGSPVEGESSFTDVADGAPYAQAVAWAVKNSVTAGMGDGTFGSAVTCTRAQIVTFIYNAVMK